MSLGHSLTRNVEIMDITGRDWLLKSMSEMSSIIQWSNCIVLCYDITDRHSFNFVHKLYAVVTEKRSSYGPVLVVGNKLDLERGRNVDRSEGKSFATKIGALFQEVSTAESAHMIVSTFENLIQQVLYLRSNCCKRIERPLVKSNKSTEINSSTKRKSFKQKLFMDKSTGTSQELIQSNIRPPSTEKSPSLTCVRLTSESLSPLSPGSFIFSFSPTFTNSSIGSFPPPTSTSSPYHCMRSKKYSLASHLNLLGSVFTSSSSSARKGSISSKNM